jgi:hypothetical protein
VVQYLPRMHQALGSILRSTSTNNTPEI